MPSIASFKPPPVDEYVVALHALSNVTDRQIQMLRVHYKESERTMTATRLAELVGYSSYTAVNAQYGRLARLIGDLLNYSPEPEHLGSLVRFENRKGEWHWLMRPEVAEALERVGWVEESVLLLPEELSASA